MLKLSTFLILIKCSLLLFVFPVQSDQNIKDQFPKSLLYSKPLEFIPNIWSAIGATGPPNYENTGHNNNLTFITSDEGVIVINAGASSTLAKALHDEIKKITSKPVKLVINENGQGHAMLGNSYWIDLGVPILAHEDAIKEFEENGTQILNRMISYNREKSDGTRLVLPTISFKDNYVINLGNISIEVLYLGPAHSPGDISVWVPSKKLIIAGDMAFHERLLPIFPETNTREWINTWDNKFEKLNAIYVIPGHGHPTNMSQVRRYTRDYLVYIREKIGTFLEKGGELKDAYYVDQTPFSHLQTFKELATRNAGRVYEEMEFE